MSKKKSPAEVYKDVVYSVSDLYSYTELQKMMEANTKAAFREVGFNVDKEVVYVRIFLYLLINVVGAYTMFFVHVEKNKKLLKLMLAFFFTVFSSYIGYDKVWLRCATFRVKLKNCKVLVWSSVKKMDGTFELKYKKVGSNMKKEKVTFPLGELFYDNGDCDYDHFVNLVQKLKPKIVSLETKVAKKE